MSRRMDQKSSRGKQAQRSNSRKPFITLNVGAQASRRGAHRQPFASKKTLKHTQPPSISDAESSSGGDDSDDLNFDDQTDDADDESEEIEEPEVDFPSHFAALRGGTGSLDDDQQPFDHVSEPDTWTGFPDTVDQNYPDWLDDEEIKKTLFDSDDDQVYEKVNEVSDSDNEEDEEALERAEAAFYESQLQDEFNNPWASHFANQIDGMSAYGFGDEDTDEGSNVFAFSGSDDLNDSQARRVHFEERPSPALEKAMAVLADSPTISRSLLPAALQYGDDTVAHDDDDNDENQDDYDSDATVELEAPAKAWRSTANREKNNVESTPPLPTRRPAGQKGPIRGTFEDSGDKVTAILDSTGKKLLLSDPHLLGGVFARRFGPSVPGSPSVGFSEAVFGESDTSEASLSPRPSSAQPILDLMLPGLTSGEHASINGHAIGLPEAFMPHDSSFLNEMCPRVFDDDTNDPEESLRIQDMITFDGDNDSEDPDYRSSFPSISAPSTPLAHLNNMNVSAFKRKAETTYMPRSSNLTALINKHLMSPSESSPLKRKRKSDRYSSPYKDAHYQGVTPVQRMAYQEHPSSPAPHSSAHGHKRRKTMF